ncbi:Serine/threonine-protein kinase PBS1 [Glycine max]|uniref:serine/threonine-protein kinase PBS1-like n=1 Tax=Glycine soja TaxID=3848 RepID=UPI00103BE8FE|nr:serine/threonine-protein kinase PBS1-like [Glycine soja]KAG4923023.1 hypothetical protein JHK86_051836 [Glycine max]KAH1200486.1 Serine/threonine-protein kinase PBS1 [Glycine max]
MKIAVGAAKGLEYLHDKENPPVIYRDFKSSNILLDEGYHPKLSDFGLAKLGPVGDKSHVSTRVKGTYGYCAPEHWTADCEESPLFNDRRKFPKLADPRLQGRSLPGSCRGIIVHSRISCNASSDWRCGDSPLLSGQPGI